MATDKLNINGISEGWTGASGGSTDIDEAVASADGNEYGGGAASDAATFDLSGTVIATSDTVSGVSITARLRDAGTAGTKRALIDFIIDSSAVGTQQQSAVLGSTYINTTVTSTGWDLDWSSTQIEGAQIRITPTQSGMPGTNSQFLDCADVDITYAGPPKGNGDLQAQSASLAGSGLRSPDFDQLGFRFYADSAVGADSLAGLAAENANASIEDPASDTHFHLRIEFDEVTSLGTSGFNVNYEYRKNGGSWTTVDAASSNVKSPVTGMLCTTANGDATLTDLLTTSAKTFAQAEYDNNNTLMAIDGAANRHYENHCALTLIAADLTIGDELEFRVVRSNAAGAFGTYTRIPKITMTGANPSGNGSLASGSASVSGEGVSSSSGDGSLDDTASQVSGSGDTKSSGDGDLASGNSSVSGSGSQQYAGNGDLAAAASDITGEGVSSSSGNGSLESGNASISGEGTSSSSGNGSLASGTASLSASGASVSGGNGDLAAGASTLAGSGTSQSIGNGDLTGTSTLSGSGERTGGESGNGSLASSAATLSAGGTLTSVGNGDLQAGACALSGSGTNGSAAPPTQQRFVYREKRRLRAQKAA